MTTSPAGAGRVVITGGAGFVGRAAVSAFAGRGHPVTVVDRVAHPAPHVHSVVGELTDPTVITDVLSGGNVTGVVHLAALTSVLRSVQHPVATYQANVAVTQELLEICRQAGVDRFIMASTNAVVGDIGYATMDEAVPLRPLTPYGATKAAAEMLLHGYAGAYGITTSALRFTNIYGPGMQHKDSFVPRMMRAALSGGGVQIYGDGLQRRDFVAVADVVRACPLPAEHVAPKPGEMPAVIVDISQAREQLGYRPSVSLVDGLATVWQDFKVGANGIGAPSGAGGPHR